MPLPHPNHAPLADVYRRQVAEILKRYADDPTAPERLRELAEAKRAFYDALHELQVDSGQEVAPPVQ